MHPVVVDLHNIRFGVAAKLGQNILLPAVPRAVFRFDRHVGMLFLIQCNDLLNCLVPIVGAPPRETQFYGIARDLSGSGAAGFAGAFRRFGLCGRTLTSAKENRTGQCTGQYAR